MLLHPRPIAITRPRARVEIIPLIDVVFFLLATFVLFTLSLNRITSLEVVLPRAGEPGPEPARIEVGEAGLLTWNGGEVQLKELPALLAHYKSQTDNPRVMVSSERRAKFGPLVAVLDELRKAQIKSFSVATTPTR